MNHAARVRMRQRAGNIQQHRHDAQVAVAAQAAQVAGRQLHWQHRELFVAQRLVDFQNRFVAEPLRNVVFVLQHLPGCAGMRQLRKQHLDRDRRVALRVVRAPDLAMTARPDLLEQDKTI